MAELFHSKVSRKVWTEDFQSLLGLKPLNYNSAREYLYSKYPDAEWVDEYHHRLWNAYAHFLRLQPELEAAGLTVVGKKGAITKNSVLAAFYHHFAACALEFVHVGDLVPVSKIITLARDWEAVSGAPGEELR